MLSDQEMARLNQLRPENREYEDLSTAQLASYYWQLTNILQNEQVGKEYIYETVKQFQLMTKRLTKNPMLIDLYEQIRIFDEIRQVGEQTSDALDPYVIKVKWNY